MDKNILKLAGMIYKTAYYDAAQWQDKTGVNPANYPAYFQATSCGKYFVTDKFQREYKNHSTRVTNNWRAIGCNN